jgi:hypothetical protein
MVVQKIIGRDTIILQTVSLPGSLNYTFTDPLLITGVNQYRACLKTVNGTEICSEIIYLYFAEPHQLFVYPNPVRQSELFTVIINEQLSGELQVIDMNGRVIQRFNIENGGTVQRLPDRLPSGLYLLRFIGNNQQSVIAKLIVY